MKDGGWPRQGEAPARPQVGGAGGRRSALVIVCSLGRAEDASTHAQQALNCKDSQFYYIVIFTGWAGLGPMKRYNYKVLVV